jgi:hypothetical protein
MKSTLETGAAGVGLERAVTHLGETRPSTVGGGFDLDASCRDVGRGKRRVSPNGHGIKGNPKGESGED